MKKVCAAVVAAALVVAVAVKAPAQDKAKPNILVNALGVSISSTAVLAFGVVSVTEDCFAKEAYDAATVKAKLTDVSKVLARNADELKALKKDASLTDSDKKELDECLKLFGDVDAYAKSLAAVADDKSEDKIKKCFAAKEKALKHLQAFGK